MTNLPSAAQNRPDPFKAVRGAVDRYQRAIGLLQDEENRPFKEGMQDAVSLEEAWRSLQVVLESLAGIGPHDHPFETILIQTGEPGRIPWYDDRWGRANVRIPYRMIDMEGAGFVCRDVYWVVHGTIQNPTWIGQWGTSTELRLGESLPPRGTPNRYTLGEIAWRFRDRKGTLSLDDLQIADDPLALTLQLTAHAEEALRLAAGQLEQQAAMIEQLRPRQRRPL